MSIKVLENGLWIEFDLALDSIRLETHGMTPTLSLIRLMITHKSLRRANPIVSGKIEAETVGFQTARTP